MGAAPSDDDDEITGINVTPLVDITLVLLIIFMVTTSVISNTEGMGISKPESTQTDKLEGATLVELPERFRQQGLFGVVASKVAPGSRAARSGLRAGDRIGQVNRRNVADLPAFRSTLAAEPRELVLSVARGGRFGYLVMQ